MARDSRSIQLYTSRNSFARRGIVFRFASFGSALPARGPNNCKRKGAALPALEHAHDGSRTATPEWHGRNDVRQELAPQKFAKEKNRYRRPCGSSIKGNIGLYLTKSNGRRGGCERICSRNFLRRKLLESI